jgi:gas vesicle protein
MIKFTVHIVIGNLIGAVIGSAAGLWFAWNVLGWV